MLSSRKTRVLKYGLMLLLVCLAIGTASTAFGASITAVESTVQPDGTVYVKATLDEGLAGKQVTILVTDYTENNINKAIKYIDQVGDVSAIGEVEFNFKMRDADAAAKQIYKLAIGGTDVSTPRVETLFKPAMQILSGISISGPVAVTADELATGVSYAVKAVDQFGNIMANPSITWSFKEGEVQGLTISNGTVTGATAVEQFTVVATAGSLTAEQLVKITNTAAVDFNDDDFKSPEAEVIKAGTNAPPIEQKFSGAFVTKKPILASDALTINIPAPSSAQSPIYTVKIYNANTGALVKVEESNTNEFDMGTLEAGRYRIECYIVQSDNKDKVDYESKRVIYIGVAPSTQTMLVREDAGENEQEFSHNDIIVSINGNEMTIEVINAPENTEFKYYMLPAEYVGENSKDKWIVLSDYTTSTLTVAKPPEGQYLISVYARNKYSGEYVDAWRSKTITINE